MIVNGGVRAKEVAQAKIKAICPNCQAADSIIMRVYQTYGHVIFIPLFPGYKTATTQCSNCGQVLQKKQFPEAFKSEYENLKKGTKIPAWMFTGLGLIAILAVVGFLAIQASNKASAEYIQAPLAGDIYKVKLARKQYTLLKVNKVVGDTVYLTQSEYITDLTSGFEDLKTKPYMKEMYPVTKGKLKAMFDNDEIEGVDREEE